MPAERRACVGWFRVLISDWKCLSVRSARFHARARHRFLVFKRRKKRRGRQNQKPRWLLPWGYFSVAGSESHRRGDVFGGHVGEGLAARSPDRRLGASRGVPGNPERDLELVCGGRKGAIRVSCVRARRLAKQRFGKGVKIACSAGKHRSGAHLSRMSSRSSPWRSRRCSDRCSPCHPRR